MKFGEVRLFVVSIGPHRVAGRYVIPAWEGDVWAGSEVAARARAVRAAHVRAGVPAWRPFLRESWPYSSSAGMNVGTSGQIALEITEP